MSEAEPSWSLLLDVVTAEREKQLAHFDSLDTKAGVVLAATTVTATLANGVSLHWLQAIFVYLFALTCSGCALAALWPRQFPMADVPRLTDYAAADVAFTQRALLDASEQMWREAAAVTRRKAQWLRLSMVSIAATGTTLAIAALAR